MPQPQLQRPALRIRRLSVVAPGRGLDVGIYDEICENFSSVIVLLAHGLTTGPTSSRIYTRAMYDGYDIIALFGKHMFLMTGLPSPNSSECHSCSAILTFFMPRPWVWSSGCTISLLKIAY